MCKLVSKNCQYRQVKKQFCFGLQKFSVAIYGSMLLSTFYGHIKAITQVTINKKTMCWALKKVSLLIRQKVLEKKMNNSFLHRTLIYCNHHKGQSLVVLLLATVFLEKNYFALMKDFLELTDPLVIWWMKVINL